MARIWDGFVSLPPPTQVELVIAETRQADGACCQVVYRSDAPVEAADLERLCVKVSPVRLREAYQAWDFRAWDVANFEAN